MIWKTVNKNIIHRLFYPTVPVIVVVRDNDTIGGMPANSCMPLSFNPPMIGLSVSPEHRTHKLLCNSKYFTINWVDWKYGINIELLSSKTEKNNKNKISKAGFKTKQGKIYQTTVLEESVAVIECKVKKTQSIGDHDLFISEVLEAYASEDFNEYWNFKTYSPALYLGIPTKTKLKMNSKLILSKFLKIPSQK